MKTYQFTKEESSAIMQLRLDEALSIASVTFQRTGRVGKEYDYNFQSDDDTYYCTEIAIEYLNAALKPEKRPSFSGRKVHVPGLLNSHVIEPVELLDGEGLTVVAANQAATSRYAEYVEGVDLV